MNYEKAYKDALSRAKDVHTYCDDREQLRKIESIFPELAESEEEKIRKKLIHLVYKSYEQGGYALHKDEADEMLTWLEKQGEQKPIYDFNADNWYVSKVDGKIHNIYNSGVESKFHKFHEGNWIIFNGLTLYVNDVVQGYYRTISIGGIPNSYDWDIDNVARLWTIQDARDGDILTSKYGQTFIYNGYYDSSNVGAYGGVDSRGDFACSTTGKYWTSNTGIHPATKEQRDVLFQKMHEAGYEWDEEKKQLKKIKKQSEQNSPILSNSSNIGKIGGFDAELNALLKKYESLYKVDIIECLEFYTNEIKKKLKEQQ